MQQSKLLDLLDLLVKIERNNTMQDSVNIPFVDLRSQYASIAEALEPEVLDVLRTCSFISGKRVAAFSEKFAKMHNAGHCVSLSSGTDALHVALWALDIGPGDEVIVPVNTYIATAEGVSLTGAKPVFVDHDEYYNMNVEKLQAALTPNTKAVIAVHLYGQPASMDEIVAFCNDNGLTLIEDCAQSHLAEYKGTPIGTFGRAGCFSFYPGKNLGACGEAGAVITNDQDLYARMHRIHQHGVFDDKYHHIEPGHNYRMEEIQGAALGIKLNHIQAWTDARRANADKYREMLSGVGQVSCPVEKEGCKHVYHLFVIQTDDRDDLSKHLNDAGIATGLHYPTPLHLQPAYSSLGYSEGDFPIAEKACSRILSLPMFPELTEENICYIANKIKEYY